jgi:hypothetical protein
MATPPVEESWETITHNSFGSLCCLYSLALTNITVKDRNALAPLIWDHVNPYGRFELDMTARLPLSLSTYSRYIKVVG